MLVRNLTISFLMGIYIYLVNRILTAFTVPADKSRKYFIDRKHVPIMKNTDTAEVVFLDKIIYNKLLNGVIIIQMKDEKRVLKF